jgi:hypothetical protein
MNLFKLFIPKDKGQVVTELESWTVRWEVATSLRWGQPQVYHKVFVKENKLKTLHLL